MLHIKFRLNWPSFFLDEDEYRRRETDTDYAQLIATDLTWLTQMTLKGKINDFPLWLFVTPYPINK